ncbi:MAG: GH36-type glycosyl hydrolase domain-containing protein, partial [Candidatus Hodarchaeota archaeon]
HEWITNSEGYSWFNGYYDNNGKQLEGDFPKGVRMTLTGQVFTIMGDIATEKQIYEIINSVEKYLWDENVGGVRLNTDFKEVLLTIGRCFGFAYGHKENGAMFSHMAVMYAYALYKQGMVKEGFNVLDSIYHHCIDFNKCRIYPGIPEYINQRGRGMYHYLTGSASWLLLTILTRVFGVRGELGDLLIEPQLMASQFDKLGKARVTTLFANRRIRVTINNEKRKEAGEYRINKVRINDIVVSFTKYENGALIPREFIEELKLRTVHNMFVDLN